MTKYGVLQLKNIKECKMRKSIFYLGLVLIFLLPAIEIGNVEADGHETTWSVEQLISGRYTVDEGEHLIIQPGTIVRFDGGGSLYVKGEITAVGTSQDPITFTSNSSSPFPGIWDKISFKSQAAENSIMRFCKIEYAAQGISISAPYLKIENNILMGIEKYGIKVQGGSNAYLANNTITTQNIGIRVAESSEPVLRNNTLEDNDFYGVYNDGNSKPQIVENRISNSEWGIYSHLASPTINENRIEYCTFGVVNYLSSGVIEHNTILNSIENGIKVRYANPDIFNNTISNSGGDGVYAFYSSPRIQGNIISGNELWGIESLGAFINIGENDFNSTTQNVMGRIRQGLYLTFNPKDDTNESLFNVDFTARDESDVVVFSGNTQNNASYLLDLTIFIVHNDGDIITSLQYSLILEKKGFNSRETTLTTHDNKELDIVLTEKEPSNKNISGFGPELLIFGFVIHMLLRRRQNSDI
jgi:parallel beta-helix repeat protein